MIVAEGVPWPCAMPSPNGEVTRVVMLASSKTDVWEISTGLELPGTGHIAISRNAGSEPVRFKIGGKLTKTANHLLHFLPHSLTSYALTLPSSSTVPQRASSPNNRAVSSAVPSPNLLRPRVSGEHERSIRRNRSMGNLEDEAHLHDKETGFAKFLAHRRPATKEEIISHKAAIGEGKEVERDGYVDWSTVRLDDSGNGLGIRENAVDVREICCRVRGC